MDAYDLQARHAPVVFALLPVALVAIALVPEIGHSKLQTGSIAFILVSALTFVIARFARSLGRARQERLYAAWGGQPTTAMLRIRDSRLNAQTKLVYRDRLRRLGESFPIPSEEEERQDQQAADVQIGAAMDEVRRRAKQKGSKAVHRENINYGAARNAYGLKPYGLGACLFSALVLAFVIVRRDPLTPTGVEIAIGMGLVAIAAAWIFASTPNGVRHHAEAYALALFEAIETLVPAPRKRATARGSTPAANGTDTNRQ